MSQRGGHFLAIGFYTLTSTGTSDFLLSDFTWIVFLGVISLLESVIVGGVGTAVFLPSKRLLVRHSPTSRACGLWLGLPAWIPAALLFAYTGWSCLPQQRLKSICKGHLVAARDVRVAGAQGLQVAEWLAVFTVEPEEFQKLVQKLALEPIPAEDFVARREDRYMLRSNPLSAEWPAVASTKLQCFRWLHKGFDGFNMETSTPVTT